MPIRVELETADDITLVGDLYNAELNVQTPAVLLTHMGDGTRSDWNILIPLLVEKGYRVLAVDLRGHGESGGRLDWEATIGDMQAWLDWMREQPAIQPDSIAIVGANMALIGCANDARCVTAVALSPSLEPTGTVSDALENGLRSRSALLLATQNDFPSSDDVKAMVALAGGELGVHLLHGQRFGTALLGNPLIPPIIVNWLDAHLR